MDMLEMRRVYKTLDKRAKEPEYMEVRKSTSFGGAYQKKAVTE